MDSLSLAEALDTAEEIFLAVEANPHKSWLKNASASVAIDYLWATANKETNHHLDLVGGYLLMWAVGKPWWAKAPIVQEDLLLRVGNGGGLHAVTAFLEQRAVAWGAAGVAFGSALSARDPALLRLYRQHGYSEQASLMYKEIQ